MWYKIMEVFSLEVGGEVFGWEVLFSRTRFKGFPEVWGSGFGF